eukprot:2558201-Rhodomonas_salina.1
MAMVLPARVCQSHSRSAMRLRFSYAKSGTDIAHGPICPRFCYAMSSTDKAYGPMSLRVPYAISGTDTAYDPTRRYARRCVPTRVCARLAYVPVSVPLSLSEALELESVAK